MRKKNKYDIKKDCFALREIRNLDGNTVNYRCTALEDLYCAKEENCSFYKNRRDYNNDYFSE